MKHVLSLRAKIIVTFVALSLVTLGGGITLFLYSYKIDSEYKEIVQREMVLYKLARDMELDLANQKGFLTYYLVDGDVKWLGALGQYKQIFLQELQQAKQLANSQDQKGAISELRDQYRLYVETKESTITDYQSGSHSEVKSISSLHERQRDVFFALLEKCRTFSRFQWERIEGFRQENDARSVHLRISALGGLALWLFLSGILVYILYRNILSPIRGLALQTGGSIQESARDEVFSLSQSLEGIMKVFDETHGELERSRKHLQQAERMAMVGELAAGVAHTIRNPFTSIKMRMFSLTRSLDLNTEQNDDLTVISDEIGRIDKIVQNFLEFARPPKLHLKHYDLSEIISSVQVLLEFRLRKYDAELKYMETTHIPTVYVDQDRLKEAFVNLVTNSCEAMARGGTVRVRSRAARDPELGKVVIITISDTGPGIPADIVHQVTAPFFTTKEDGSGLGLSIVKRIMQEHGGRMSISTLSGENTEITLILPLGSSGDGTDNSH